MIEQSDAHVDLTNCDREPIHIPGTILPHGAMLVVDPATMTIEQVAGDTTRLLGVDPNNLAGQNLSRVFSEDQVVRLNHLRAASALSRPRHILDPLMRAVSDRPIDASVHISDDALVIEVEDADLADRHAVDPLACVQDMIDGLGDTPDLQSYCQLAAERVRSVAGYDRVMAYRFMDDESGWVFAEARRDDVNPFLDLHYPASDIPKQARALYLTSWLRLITEVDYTPAPLLPTANPRSGRPLDMSYATLRDVSPIHREYLRNMGVDASMSISIISEGKLWGLIACHNYSPRRLPRHLRAVCELFGSMFSLQLEVRLRAEKLEARLRSRKALADIMHALTKEDDYGAGLVAQGEHLLEYIAAGGLALRVGQTRGGVAIRVNSGITAIGETPDDDQIGALTDWLTAQMKDFEGVFTTDRLGEIYPPARAYAGIASGLLAVSVSREPRDFILWFRPEVIETVRWGGDPHKPVEMGPNGSRLTPRKSFDEWAETVRGRSLSWSPSDSDAAADLRVSLLEIVLRRIDAAARERLRAVEHEKMLMAELDHRVKNTLAVIQALVWQTSRSASSLMAFTEGLDRRIQSMSRAHSLLTQSRWEGISIAELIHEELAPYIAEHRAITIEGDAAVLEPKSALSLSLAIHELATNAVKYGSLSATGGALAVGWTISEDGRLNLTWRESGGPEVKKPKSRGFGSTLIERALRMETGGHTELQFEPSGLVCNISLPASSITKTTGSKAPSSPQAAKTPMAETVPGGAKKRILLVEDSALVLMLIEGVIVDMDWEIIGPASRVAEAITLAQNSAIDAALLDVNLDGEMSWGVAAILQQRGIPFAFTTGYDSASVVPEGFAEQTIINKPFSAHDIRRTLQKLIS